MAESAVKANEGAGNFSFSQVEDHQLQLKFSDTDHRENEVQFSSAFGGGGGNIPTSNSNDLIKLSISDSISQLVEDTKRFERRQKRLSRIEEVKEPPVKTVVSP